MSSVKINYDSILSSAAVLESVSHTAKKSTDELPSLRESIVQLGKNHDNCFNNISNNIETDIDSIISEIQILSSDMTQAVDIYSQAELSLLDNINIESKGIESVIKNNYMKTYQKNLTGYDHEYYETLLEKTLKSATGERAKSVAAALFLATSFPHMNYFWGGGHDKISIGLDPSWGEPKVVTAAGSKTTGTKQPNSLDCSGYISWALKNGGYDISKPMVTSELEKLGEKVPITKANENNIKVGDLAYMQDHVGMIINVDKNVITVSHCSGSGDGMNITKMDTNTGIVIEDWNGRETTNTRVGKTYFTDIVKVNYQN